MTETILINLFHMIIYIDKDKTVKYHIRVCLSIDFRFFFFVLCLTMIFSDIIFFLERSFVFKIPIKTK